MRPDFKKNLVILSVVCVALFFLFNLTHTYFENAEIRPVPAWLVIPFVLLLGSIALAPFVNRHWWERNYPAVSYALGIVVVLYYILVLNNVPRLLLTFSEYVSFITLVGALFVVSGGIHVRIRGKSAPYENVILLAFGALISNLLGTTGASMLLIRPYLRVNKFRIKPYHVVFFIFIVGNIGGSLTPIGDPPLFLGYLKGIPFFWVIGRLWYIWALALAVLLMIFYIVDSISFKRETARLQERALVPEEPEFSGLHNIFYLAVVIGAVFISHPVMLREILMAGAAFASYYSTKSHVHGKNEFTFTPIREVAILFIGIFATMIPALDWLEMNSSTLGIVSPGQYYWGSGLLSSVLDNAPTYLNFLSAGFGLHGASVDNLLHMDAMLGLATPQALGLHNPLVAGAFAITQDSWKYIQAISVGSVFFGACTYIGNAPNFMIKSIAEHSKVHCPSFLGYITKYAIPILIPVYATIWYLYFR